MKNEEVFLLSYSRKGVRDWYGDFTYFKNPLEKYLCKSDLWDTKIIDGSIHGIGIAGIAVKTTLDALETLGWKDDYEQFKTTKERWENLVK